MRPDELYNLIGNISYTTIGDSVDYAIIPDHEEKKIRILFQCSISKRDWINNLMFFPAIHYVKWCLFFGARGWLNAWETAQEEILSKILEAKQNYPEYKIQIAGHSYGGTIAIWTVIEYFFRTKNKVDELITFGAAKPLIGLIMPIVTRFFVKYTKQYSHWQDLVTYLPPLPFYWRLNTKRVGEGWWKFWRIIHAEKYHTSYGNAEYYKKEKDV